MEYKECKSCPHTDKCREVWAEENKGPLTSGGLAIFSAIAFLLPIAAAIIAGTIARADRMTEKMQMLYALAGLIVGGAIASLIVYILKNKFNRNEEKGSCLGINDEYLG